MICQQAARTGLKARRARAPWASRRSARELAVEASTRMSSTPRWTGSLERQERIEDRLARRHLATASWCSTTFPRRISRGAPARLPRLGYSRDGRRGTPQIVYGLLCDRPAGRSPSRSSPASCTTTRRCPPSSRSSRRRFGLKRVIVCRRPRHGHQGQPRADGVKRRGRVDHRAQGAADQEARRTGALQLSLFDETQPRRDHQRRLSPASGWSSAATRWSPPSARASAKSCLPRPSATSSRSPSASRRGTLTGADQIGLAVGPALKRYRVKKHFDVEITDTRFSYRAQDATRSPPRPRSTASTCCAPRVAAERSRTAEVVRAYKELEQVERAFGTFKGPELEIRPIHHRLEDRVRAHVLLCMLAYYLDLAPAPGLGAAALQRRTPADRRPTPSPRPPARPAPSARPHTKRTSAGEPCHSYTQPARRTRHPDPQHDPPRRQPRDLHQARRAHPTTGPRARARRLDHHHVATNPTSPIALNPSSRAETRSATAGTSA